MRKFICLLSMAMLLFIGSAIAEVRPLIQKGNYNENVVALHEKLSEFGLYSLRASSPFSQLSEDGLKVLQWALGLEGTGFVRDQAEQSVLLLAKTNECENLAIGTEDNIILAPIEENNWCSPVGFYQTSESGMKLLADEGNKYFTATFDWQSKNADTAVNASVSLKDVSGSHYKAVGGFFIPIGDSSGHCVVTFEPTEGMREFGTGWIISRMGAKNRNIEVIISNFRFMNTKEWITE